MSKKPVQISAFLRPSPDEIRELAIRETTLQYAPNYRPITKGPIIAVLLLAIAGLASIPFIALRLIRALIARLDRN